MQCIDAEGVWDTYNKSQELVKTMHYKQDFAQVHLKKFTVSCSLSVNCIVHLVPSCNKFNYFLLVLLVFMTTT